jgi:two-component system, OmpR family, phosphate regulon response regulator PhoB
VALANDGSSGLTKALTDGPALVLIDAELPVLSGFEVCRQLKSVTATRHIPILMLSARNGDQDRIRGLELGAEDYIGKPCSSREVVLRVQRSLGRMRPMEPVKEVLRVGGFVLDPLRHELRHGNKLIGLTAVEFKLFALLMKNRGHVLEREKLLTEVWGYENSVFTRTVDTHIQRIRGKLGEADCIETVRGVGYRVRDESILVEVEAPGDLVAA